MNKLQRFVQYAMDQTTHEIGLRVELDRNSVILCVYNSVTFDHHRMTYKYFQAASFPRLKIITGNLIRKFRNDNGL